ncbi:MAG: hypothetical protein OXJ52_04420 [Oligoflexia bacterium]|nr:hypothetical protein [Oligoflexia bacterium]
MKRLFLLLLFSSFTLSCYIPPPDISKNPLPLKKVRDVVFWPLNSLSFRLSEVKDKKAFVIILRDQGQGKVCSISEKYGNQLKIIMEQEYSKKGFQFIYVYVGQENPHNMARLDLKNFEFKAPYVVDLKQRIINILSAQTTGEIFILASDRQMIYRGPLDDSHYRADLTVKNYYVKEVLDDLLTGKKIKTKELPAPGCIISRPKLPIKVYWKDVAPIIKKKCTICHNPRSMGPMNFVRYEDVIGRGKMFEYVIENDLMPPAYVADNLELEFLDGSLGVKEKAMLLKWAKTGFEKEQSFQNEALWAEEKMKKWQPDYVIRLPEKVVIPEEGFLYHRFLIDPKFKKDKWIEYVEWDMKPKVIHHARLYIMKPDFELKRLVDFNKHPPIGIIGFVGRNSRGRQYHKRKETARGVHFVKIPAEHKLVVEIHYEALGKEMIDDYSHIKLDFSNKKPKYQTSILRTDIRNEIHIPPNESHYHIKKVIPVKKTLSSVYLINSHMHFRGKRSSLFLIDLNGNRKRIYGIDPYLVPFEKGYLLKKPFHIPKGSTLEYHWWYDNSLANIFNPNPYKEVLYGLDLVESEMGTTVLWHQVMTHTSK